MKKNQSQLARAYLSRPGDTLLETIEKLRMPQAELAERMGKTPSKINDLIMGKEPFTINTALQLEMVLNIPASFWTQREASYREQLARIEEEEKLECFLPWAQHHPIKELMKCGYIKTGSFGVEAVKKLLLFYGVVSPNQWEVLYAPACANARYRKSAVHQSAVASISAWLRMGETDLNKLDLPLYNRELFKEAIQESRKIAARQPKDFAKQLYSLCAKAGVGVVYTKCLPKAPISGAARWVSGKPLIQLTDRYKSNDCFWFTFYHEAGHILLHGKKEIFLDAEETAENNEKEVEADSFAARTLLPEKFIEEVSTPVTHENILSIAKRYNMHPGIVVGRLQKMELLSYAMGNKFKEKISLFDGV